MTYKYKIKNLSTAPTGIPLVPGSRKVSVQMGGLYVAYGHFVNRRSAALAVVYRDSSGNYLVGAEPAVLDTMPGNDDLEGFAKKDPSKWHTWKCDVVKSDGSKIKDQIVNTSKMALNISATNPVAEADGNVIVGGTPTVPCGLGDFSVIDIDKETKWIGDKVDKDVQEVV